MSSRPGVFYALETGDGYFVNGRFWWNTNRLCDKNASLLSVVVSVVLSSLRCDFFLRVFFFSDDLLSSSPFIKRITWQWFYFTYTLCHTAFLLFVQRPVTWSTPRSTKWICGKERGVVIYHITQHHHEFIYLICEGSRPTREAIIATTACPMNIYILFLGSVFGRRRRRRGLMIIIMSVVIVGTRPSSRPREVLYGANLKLFCRKFTLFVIT